MKNTSTLPPIREWLQSGWILEIRSRDGKSAGEDVFWVGGFADSTSTFQSSKSKAWVWAPSFFEPSLASREASWFQEITRTELVRWLAAASIVQEKAAVAWTTPDRTEFEKSFRRIQNSIRSGEIRKAVPVVFASGVSATSNRLSWIGARIRAGLEATAGNGTRLYGSWSSDRGAIGATPEDLVTWNRGELTSMAVAGTSSLVNSENVDAQKRVLETDPKERAEHQFVIEDILQTVENSVGIKRSAIETGDTRAVQFRGLLHLVTELRACYDGDSEKILRLAMALHPTAALGVFPRDAKMSFLKALDSDREVRDGIERGSFGAPFAVQVSEVETYEGAPSEAVGRIEAVVAIRQIRWRFEGGDRLQLELGSGCGIVSESVFENEWNELAAKRRSVQDTLQMGRESRNPVGWAVQCLETLVASGVRSFVFCAGARNAPLVVALEAFQRKGFVVEAFFEERSAAFYALGKARAQGRPVAVVTTSGTAVTELTSALAEADFSGVPLVAVTADRPRRLRYSGAPQAIDQDQVFARFVDRSFDLEEGAVVPRLESWNRARPLHLNLCFEEPLLSDAPSESAVDLMLESPGETRSSFVMGAAVTEVSRLVERFSILRDTSGAVAIVSTLESSERPVVAEFLQGHSLPCLLEATSGLRGDSRLKHLELRGGDRDLGRWCKAGEISAVLRLGGVPTTRVWRDLDEPSTKAETFSISSLRFSGLGRGHHIQTSLTALRQVSPRQARGFAPSEKRWLEEDRSSAERLEKALEVSTSEPALVRALSNRISGPQTTDRQVAIYVGNSLPIRWWDLVAERNSALPVLANRGVNGIDGQISTALGIAAGGNFDELWIVVGDLTAIYDLAGLWAVKYTGKTKIRVAVINNSGGMIFRRVLARAPSGSASFENHHDLEFKGWAEMWGFQHAVCKTTSDVENTKLQDRVIMELRPDAVATSAFWKAVE